jgi:hypothetical protein
MKSKAMSRRTLFKAGTCLLAAAAIPKIAHAQSAVVLNPGLEELIRKHYKTWEEKDWHTENMLLADDFTFSSAAGDDHISKSTFKKQCWDTQIDHIKHFDLLKIFGSGSEAFVMYDCLTMNDKTFRNVEYFQVRGDKVESLFCFFGAQSNFPSAVSGRAS